MTAGMKKSAERAIRTISLRCSRTTPPFEGRPSSISTSSKWVMACTALSCDSGLSAARMTVMFMKSTVASTPSMALSSSSSSRPQLAQQRFFILMRLPRTGEGNGAASSTTFTSSKELHLRFTASRAASSQSTTTLPPRKSTTADFTPSVFAISSSSSAAQAAQSRPVIFIVLLIAAEVLLCHRKHCHDVSVRNAVHHLLAVAAGADDLVVL